MRTIVVSAVNLFTGGPLTIGRDFLRSLQATGAYARGELKVIFFCHSAELYADLAAENLALVEKPLARKSWLLRLFYEYLYFRFWSAGRGIEAWISLHDITPNVKAKRRLVYCHNATPFYRGRRYWSFEPSFGLFTLFYKHLYRLGIRRNDYVIVQQQWMRDEFVRLFACDAGRVIVAKPTAAADTTASAAPATSQATTTLFYPALPRVFKNFEVLLEAMKLAADVPLKLVLTVSGQENKYAQSLVRK